MSASAQSQSAEAGKRGRLGLLKVFLGIGPGVGKTAAMLQAAAVQQTAGRDVVIALADASDVPGAEMLPRIEPCEGGINVDAIVSRCPDIAVVDELAGNNPDGARRSKRYHDVLALLEAGMDVFSTLNIYEIASRAEILWPFTGIATHEAVPDGMLDNAEISLVDLPAS